MSLALFLSKKDGGFFQTGVATELMIRKDTVDLPILDFFVMAVHTLIQYPSLSFVPYMTCRHFAHVHCRV